jgi:hypothetical protein
MSFFTVKTQTDLDAEAAREQVLIDALRAGVTCRDRQKAYFAKRSTTNLIAAKEAESAFDKMAHEALAAVPHRHPATNIGE